jgi:CO dehydrogenase maturation factor
MKTIAISGKGGTGKTTIAAMIVRWLSDRGNGPVLAVDADANVNLNEVLGVEIKETIGAIREEMKNSVSDLPGGMTKQQFLEYKIQSSLVEAGDFDLIAMGRPEGPGCYCYANNLLRDILGTLHSNYRYVVIDNEAGMEHLSRQTTQSIDYLCLISDPTPRGIRAAGKISRLLKELDTRAREKYLILNRVQSSNTKLLNDTIDEEGLKLICRIPEDNRLLEMDRGGKAIDQFAVDSPACSAVDKLLRELIGQD